MFRSVHFPDAKTPLLSYSPLTYSPLTPPMHSELFRIPIRWAGVPIFGFGLLLAAWLAATAWGVMQTAKQHALNNQSR